MLSKFGFNLISSKRVVGSMIGQVAGYSSPVVKPSADSPLSYRVTRSDLVTPERWAELDAIESGFQQHLQATEFKGHRHCAATGYWPRLRQYRKGTDSYLFETLEDDKYMGHYIVSCRDVYFQGDPHSIAYGYLARVDPSLQSKGIGKFLMAHCTAHFAKMQTMTMGTMARTNYAQLKAQIVTRKVSGQRFQGEMAVYLVDPTQVPKIPVPPKAKITLVDSEQQVEDLWEKIYAKEGARLRLHTAEFLQSPLHGGHWVISDGQSEAGLSIWNPDFGVTVDLDGSHHKRSIFYNLWSKGPHGVELLQALYSKKLQETPVRFVIATVWRTKAAPPEKRREHIFPEVPTYSSAPIEHFISPHSLGVEEEMCIMNLSTFYTQGTLPREEQPCFFWDPRDCSTFLGFHPPFKTFDF